MNLLRMKFKNIILLPLILCFSCSKIVESRADKSKNDSIKLNANGDTLEVRKMKGDLTKVFLYEQNKPKMMLTYKSGRLNGDYYYFEGDSLIYGKNYFCGNFKSRFVFLNSELINSSLVVMGKDSLSYVYNNYNYLNGKSLRSSELKVVNDSIYFDEFNIAKLVGRNIDHYIYISELDINYNETKNTKILKSRTPVFMYQDEFAMIGVVFLESKYDSALVRVPIPPCLQDLDSLIVAP